MGGKVSSYRKDQEEAEIQPLKVKNYEQLNKDYIKVLATSLKQRNLLVHKRISNPLFPHLLLRERSEKEAVTVRRPLTKEAARPITVARQNTADKLYHRKSNMPNRVLHRSLSENRPQEIKNYEIKAQLGSGAYAAVKSSVHKTTGQIVAIKIYEKYKLISSQRKNCVNREVRVLRNISHPNIVKFYEAIETPREVCIVMELVKGDSLLHYIKHKSEKRLPEYEAIRIFKQVLSAIEYCHKMNIVHRDIKMENILLDDRLDAKLIDFGFSTWAMPSQRLKIFCGTPSYMAPEIVNKKDYYGPPADMWSLGILLYAMLCGHFPFRASTEFELYRHISKGLFNIPAHVSEAAKKLIYKLLVVEPRRRMTAERASSDPYLNP
eukprot:TRINITY_DN577_c0_g1_i22.p1 TRINITY_DN577_c0_g1~~TRINITY_DN577_c0_g1_i22.p1  ORF type:complete len:379 (+),score=78.89 TRINITY_DN577_c0_g1_i22:105-1241(+)